MGNCGEFLGKMYTMYAPRIKHYYNILFSPNRNYKIL